MEDWEFEFEWLRVRHLIRKSFGKEQLPDLNAMLFLIGIQEIGFQPGTKFSKEEKISLTSNCSLLTALRKTKAEP